MLLGSGLEVERGIRLSFKKKNHKILVESCENNVCYLLILLSLIILLKFNLFS